MGKIYVLEHQTGDTAIVWDVANQQATEVARAKFNELSRSGHLMTEVVEGQGQTMVRTFNPEAQEIVAVRQLTGG